MKNSFFIQYCNCKTSYTLCTTSFTPPWDVVCQTYFQSFWLNIMLFIIKHKIIEYVGWHLNELFFLCESQHDNLFWNSVKLKKKVFSFFQFSLFFILSDKAFLFLLDFCIPSPVFAINIEFWLLPFTVCPFEFIVTHTRKMQSARIICSF